MVGTVFPTGSGRKLSRRTDDHSWALAGLCDGRWRSRAFMSTRLQSSYGRGLQAGGQWRHGQQSPEGQDCKRRSEFPSGPFPTPCAAHSCFCLCIAGVWCDRCRSPLYVLSVQMPRGLWCLYDVQLGINRSVFWKFLTGQVQATPSSQTR